MSKVQIYSHVLDSENRLGALGLSSHQLRFAVQAGQTHRNWCTGNDPSSAPGWEAWRWTVRVLREKLVPKGWRPRNIENLPLIVQPVKHIAIAVTSGDVGTGIEDCKPTTKYPKGPATCDLVVANKQKLLFDEKESLRLVSPPRQDQLVTWLLMANPESSAMTRCELSLPSTVDQRGFISEWRERIILEPVNNTTSVPEPGNDEEVTIDVPVSQLVH